MSLIKTTLAAPEQPARIRSYLLMGNFNRILSRSRTSESRCKEHEECRTAWVRAAGYVIEYFIEPENVSKPGHCGNNIEVFTLISIHPRVHLLVELSEFLHSEIT